MQRRLGNAVGLPRVNEMDVVNRYSFSTIVPDAGVKAEEGMRKCKVKGETRGQAQWSGKYWSNLGTHK